MVPLTIDFANLHTILGTLYEDMLPLCKDMMDVGKGLAGLGASFMSPYAYGSRWHVRADRRVSPAAPLRYRHLYPAFSHTGTWHAEHRAQSYCAGTHKMLEGQTLDMERYRRRRRSWKRRPCCGILKPPIW